MVSIDQSSQKRDSATVHATTLTLIRRNEVERRTALSRSRIYTLIKENNFPKPVRLGEMSVAWVEGEIEEWIAERIASRRAS